jgi:hypothetical protein
MFLRCKPYLLFSSNKTIACIVLFLFLGLSAYTQDTPHFHINPLRASGLKEPIKANPNLNDHFKIPNNQLMYWSYYPLTAQQIEEREKCYNTSFGQQVFQGVTESFINTFLIRNPAAPHTQQRDRYHDLPFAQQVAGDIAGNVFKSFLKTRKPVGQQPKF